jgi:hypothetical protein
MKHCGCVYTNVFTSMYMVRHEQRRLLQRLLHNVGAVILTFFHI